MEQDQAFLEYVVKAIVNNPDDVKSTRTVDERGVLITLDLNPGDMGYVIGRRGQTARAIRTLLKVVGAKNNARVNLKINEPEGGRGPAPRSSGMDRNHDMDRDHHDRGASDRGHDHDRDRDRDMDIDTSAVDTLSI
ncbi:MAG: RNA-binding protein [Candidatus Magasanikbacteria bacterium CG10_big_fil_rev_8_21_14_0_10_47_10]|uniref:RNA-binding protein KhpA n=1 Tax=Candidatus Magasanikbacteria bacterium CG10_big_fil_rev_8_21_14_0_10_47_10 TaxID=1974652 RepID=A0A2H0TR35_9BACT|nr:MAG: RNA-binding protein [Candidatus Magasanikbacteria bacterium CG10_big_fil_rev_8_21_14_0_10_47_10]